MCAWFLKIQSLLLPIRMAGSFSLHQSLRMPLQISRRSLFLVMPFDTVVARLFIGARGDEPDANALQRTRRERRGCSPRALCAGALGLGLNQTPLNFL